MAADVNSRRAVGAVVVFQTSLGHEPVDDAFATIAAAHKLLTLGYHPNVSRQVPTKHPYRLR